jgi:hypothetical protein
LREQSGTQKEEIREIERETRRSWREIGRRDKEGQARLASEVKSEIGTLLDGEQAEQFEKLLQHSIRRGGSR